MAPHAVVLVASMACGQGDALPVVVVDRDDVVIDRSCVVDVPRGTFIADANGDGVIHVRTDGVTLEFAHGAELRGARVQDAWDTLRGVGIRVEGAKGVTIRGARVHGYKVGVRASDADGLVVDGADLSDNYRQRLRSTAGAEDGADWLFPHTNDEHEWVTQHGAGLCVESSEGVEARGVRIRRGQNGIILDRVDGSRVYDNDCSFLSGWGIAMWRSSGNTISRNALDFCVRGHEEGVYNRGQDSAGLLMFEQCNGNTIVENSATHGGDGLFGFAGREALGETGREEGAGFDYARVGCNDNVIVGNDFSYASAHGLEMTFSEGNIIAGNRFVENAICGVWGGYSSGMLITGNTFDGNGGMAYGLERGAINIEHGADNAIVGNSFVNNRVALHLWWDADGLAERLAGVGKAYKGVTGNVFAGNSVTIDEGHPFGEGAELLVLHVRDHGSGRVSGNSSFGNRVSIACDEGGVHRIDPGAEFDHVERDIEAGVPEVVAIGESRPVGARRRLAGRANIVMGAWGPWDHESALFRALPSVRGEKRYEVRGAARLPVLHSDSDISLRVDPLVEGADRYEVTLAPGSDLPSGTVTPFAFHIDCGNGRFASSGLASTVLWHLWIGTFKGRDIPRPGEEFEDTIRAPSVSGRQRGMLDLPFGMRGPADVTIEDAFGAGEELGVDHFATRAIAQPRLAAGRWRLRVLSDDGVRVEVDGRVLIERWDIHGPTWDEAEFEVEEGRRYTRLSVDHFENDGYAVLRVELEPVPGEGVERGADRATEESR